MALASHCNWNAMHTISRKAFRFNLHRANDLPDADVRTLCGIHGIYRIVEYQKGFGLTEFPV